MKLHQLKIKEVYFIKILDNRKTFEIRKNDRDFQVWDLITFTQTNWKEWYRKCILEITDVFQQEWFWLEEWYCILSFKILKK